MTRADLPLWRSWTRRMLVPLALSGTVLLAASVLVVAGPRLAQASSPRSATPPAALTASDMQALIFVWASGTPAVQHVAEQTCASLHLTPQQCAQVSAAVRAAWLDLAQRDPAALGRVNARPNPAGRTAALGALSTQLASVTGGHVSQLLSATHDAFAQIASPQWARANVPGASGVLPAGTQLVWATSFLQSSLPRGFSAKRSNYVALPDAYLKYANWGNLASIPSIYQSYYAPGGTTANWTVDAATPSGTRSALNVLITEVGPWNEDDNWWDPNGASATLPASCPVASALVASDATSNPLVNGICPNGSNLRRLYYYLLYTHNGLPFFQTTGYSPTGTFRDGSAWPTAIAQQCSEAAVAATNNDGVACSGGLSGYNGHNGSWLRGGTYDAPILNQSSIDLSPALDKALGWTYPSSGLVQVYVGRLP